MIKLFFKSYVLLPCHGLHVGIPPSTFGEELSVEGGKFEIRDGIPLKSRQHLQVGVAQFPANRKRRRHFNRRSRNLAEQSKNSTTIIVKDFKKIFTFCCQLLNVLFLYLSFVNL